MYVNETNEYGEEGVRHNMTKLSRWLELEYTQSVMDRKSLPTRMTYHTHLFISLPLLVQKCTYGTHIGNQDCSNIHQILFFKISTNKCF